MSTTEHQSENLSGCVNSFAKTASKAVSMIDERVRRGADVVTHMAHQTADQMGRASNYVQQQGQRFRRRAAQAGDVANQHPIYTHVAVGLIGVGIGLLLRGGRRSDTSPGMTSH